MARISATDSLTVAAEEPVAITLSPASHVFAGTHDAAISAVLEVQITARKGQTQIPVTIVAVDGVSPSASERNTHIAGLFFNVPAGNGSTSAFIRFASTTSLIAKSGVVTIVVTVEGVTFTLRWSFALSLTGANGPLIFPAGEWSSAITYTNDGIKTPFVMRNTQYYYLSYIGNCLNVDPATDVNSTRWTVISNLGYAFYEIMMANFAKLASAVFWGDFMFSQHGKNAAGDDVSTYNNFAVDGNGKPTSAFSPNIMLNFLTGHSEFNDVLLRCSLNEPFNYIDRNDDRANITRFASFGGKFNYCVRASQSQKRVTTNSVMIPTVVMPKLDDVTVSSINAITAKGYSEDGTHCMIVLQSDPNLAIHSGSYNSRGCWGLDYLYAASTLLCADADMFVDHSVNGYNDGGFNGYFVWKGFMTKYMLLLAGDVLKLRSCKGIDTNGVARMFWMVENSSDFDILNAEVVDATGNVFHSRAALEKNILTPIIGSPLLTNVCNSITGGGTVQNDFNSGYRIVLNDDSANDYPFARAEIF